MDDEEAFSPAHRRFGQIGFWTHLEAVGPDQAPLQLLRRRDGRDMSKAYQCAAIFIGRRRKG